MPEVTNRCADCGLILYLDDLEKKECPLCEVKFQPTKMIIVKDNCYECGKEFNYRMDLTKDTTMKGFFHCDDCRCNTND